LLCLSFTQHRCYYALQGIHKYSWKEEKLVMCTTDEEQIAERLRWRICIAEVLPSSFRFAKDLPKPLLSSLIRQFHTLLEECCNRNGTSSSDLPSMTSENSDINCDDDGTSSSTIPPTANTSCAEKSLPTNTDEIITKLSFVPNGYQLQCDKTMIRKHPALNKLHKWLVQQTDSGYITRQETVSMIPPVVLNCQPTDIVLDMCAAPGSKTSQVLEVLNEQGCLVANDNNPQRAYMLVHQLKRINANNPVVVITACDGQFFPSSIKTRFNRIICDVPCTGDGTSRKNIGVWRSWTSVAAFSLHVLQYNIAWKGLSQLLHIGGYMCYSTCSLNPIENEAVVAQLLRESNGSVELVDCSSIFEKQDNNNSTTSFRIRPGMSIWKVLIESKSRKQMKDCRNKNNSKMQEKRKLYQLKKSNDDDGNNQNENSGEFDNDEVASCVEFATDDKDDALPKDEIIDEYKMDQERTFAQRFSPAKFDDDTLFKMASSCGLQHFKSFDEVVQSEQQHIIDRIKPSCFPPTPAEADAFNLHRCVRCLPHDNNTGGFFVALLRKKAAISATDRKYERSIQIEAISESAMSNHDITNSSSSLEQPVKKARIEDDVLASAINKNGADIVDIKDEQIDVDEAINMKHNLMEGTTKIGNDDCVPVADDLMDPLIEYYGIDRTTFPRQQYMHCACASETKVIYYVANSIKEKLIDNGFQERITSTYNLILCDFLPTLFSSD
jgi:tRNA (cytosine34-C5)-methyltransferase